MSDLTNSIAKIHANTTPEVVKTWADWLRANADKQITGQCFSPAGCMCTAGAIIKTLDPNINAFNYDYAPHHFRDLLGITYQEGYNLYAFIYEMNDSQLLTFAQIIELLEKIRVSDTNLDHDSPYKLARDVVSHYGISA